IESNNWVCRTNQSNIGTAYKHHKRLELTDWTEEFSIVSTVHSKALQKTVERFSDNLSNLSQQKQTKKATS
ncbi:MAG: hypothetical protein J07HQW2_01335, partial [Haloquadratum walsbyi J07HQW2]